jgi:hypothetical protein
MNRVTSWHQPSILIMGYVIMSLILGLSLAGEVAAATIRVPKDYSSIQKALDAARKGDKVRRGIRCAYPRGLTLKTSP